MNLMPVIDVISSIGFAAALFFALQIEENVMERKTRLFLSISMASYLFVSISNVLEWANVMNYPVLHGDYAIIIFLPFFMFFVYSYGNNELKKRSAAAIQKSGTKQHLELQGGKE